MSKLVVIKCAYCDKEFEAKPSELKNSNRKYCSKPCYRLSRRKRIECFCNWCGRPFETTPSRLAKGCGKFCGRECNLKARGGRITVICEYCEDPFEVKPSRLRQGCGKFCSPACHYAGRDRPLVERFWEKVIKTPDGCWLWQGAKNGDGYGLIGERCGDEWLVRFAHRVAWTLTNGPIPTGLEVCHDCPTGDNPLCVRHLFLGTQADNVKDAVRKKRHAHGEKHASAKLTEKIVIEIRTRYAAGSVSQKQLAVEFDVKEPTINSVLNGKTWKHTI